MLETILANYTTDQEFNSWAAQMVSDLKQLRKHESSFTAENVAPNGMSGMSASAIYMNLKQRKPMTIEYFEKASDIKPKSITLYINPERLQISNQKIIKKQITRGGIFYHHYGPDHSTMVLVGTTGMSGMSGIKQLEEIYYASGTLLRYNNFMPTQIYQKLDDFKIIDYSDPLMLVNNVVNNDNLSTSSIEDIQKNLLSKVDENATKSENNQIYNANSMLEIHKNNKTLSELGDKVIPESYLDALELDDKGKCLFRYFYNKVLNQLMKQMPNKDSQIIMHLAYELSVRKILENKPEKEREKHISNDDSFNYDSINQLLEFEDAKKYALKQHMKKLEEFKNREQYIKDLLETSAVAANKDFKDEWLPRQMLIYFDNKVYTGHFNSFNYARDAKSNLINYELRFTITKEYEFNNYDDPNKKSAQIEIKTQVGTEEKPKPIAKEPIPKKPVPKPPIVSKPKQQDNLYTVVKGDTLGKIAIKFYGHDKYWSNIYAANLNTVSNAYYTRKPSTAADIYPGQKLVIPSLPSGYRVWVVLRGDSLRYLAQRFYGNGNKWKRIYDANRNVISNPNNIQVKTVLKIPY